MAGHSAYRDRTWSVQPDAERFFREQLDTALESCPPAADYAEALLGLGKDEEAVYAAQQGLALGIEDGAPENIGGAWRALGIVAGKTGKPIRIRDRESGQLIDYDARTSFAKSEKIYADAEIDGERARTLREWARYELKSGDTKQGKNLWKKARDLFDKLGAQMEVDRMKELPT